MNPITNNVVDDAVHGLVASDVGVGKKRSIDVGLGALADKVHAQEPVTKSDVASTQSASSPASGVIGDEKVEKRQKRLAKNREAAQLFRQRQKIYIQDLEKRSADLTAENAALRAKVELINAENKVIRDQLAYIRSVIGNAVQINMDKMPTPVGKAPGSRVDDQDSQGGAQ